MALIAGIVALVLLFAFARIAPLLLLGLWMLVVHAPGKAFLDAPWHDWEWGIVALAVLLSFASLARKRKAKAKSDKQ